MSGLPGQYHQLSIHRRMLRDEVRGEAFRRALGAVVHDGAAVLDLGAGSGILSIFAALAGASKVFAVERTSIASLASRIVKANGLEDRIEVIEGDMSEVALPQPVDVIVSEWLGPYGIDENLLPSVVQARDRYLKPGGSMVPAAVTAWLAPVWDEELAATLEFFDARPYGVDLGLVADHTADELEYAVQHVDAGNLLAPAQALWSVDVAACSVEEARGRYEASRSFAVERAGKMNALAAWFSAELAGDISLACGPGAPRTHWGTTICKLRRPRRVETGERIDVEFACEPADPGWSWTSWSVRVGDGAWEHRDQRDALL